MEENEKKLSRRDFLKYAGIAGATVGVAGGLGGLLAACGGGATTTTTAATTATTAATTATTAGGTATTVATTVTTGAEVPTETLKVGTVLQLTDWYSVVDAMDKVDIEYMAQIINDGGGIKAGGKAYKVELVEEDGKSSLDGNTAAANALVMDAKVKFVTGPSAYFNQATSPIFEAAKVLHVAGFNACMPAEMSAQTPYEFLGLDAVAQQNAGLKAQLDVYPNTKTIAWATDDEASTPYLVPNFQAMVDRLGLQLVNRDPIKFSPQLDDFSPIVTQLNSLKADCYWIPVAPPPAYGNLVKGLRTLGNMTPMNFPQKASDTIALAGPQASTAIVNPMSKDYGMPGSPDILNKLFEKGDTKRAIFALQPNCLYMLKFAIENANSIDPTVVRDSWEKMTTIPTLFGDGFPSGNKLFGLTNHAWAYSCPVAKITNGKFEYLDHWIKPDPTP